MATWKERFNELSDELRNAFYQSNHERIKDALNEIQEFTDRYKRNDCPDHDQEMPNDDADHS